MAAFAMLFLWANVVLGILAQVCEHTHVQLEHEDGTKQVFEMKRVHGLKGTPCLLCAGKSGSTTGALMTTPLRFNVVFTPGEIFTECDTGKQDLPMGLCLPRGTEALCGEEETVGCSADAPEMLAEGIVTQGLVPMGTGDRELDKKIALAVVYINMGSYDKAIDQFTTIIKDKPSTVAAYYGRGVAYARKGLTVPENAAQALADFTEAIKKDKNRHESYERRAEVYIGLGQYMEALEDLTVAIDHRPTEKLYFMRGVINMLLENFAESEEDFRKNLDAEGQMQLMSHFHLGLALYYRGKVRNAIEVFKEVLKKEPDHLDACTSLAQAFGELGSLRAAKTRFNHSLSLQPNHSLSLQLQGSMHYHSGHLQAALADFQSCLHVEPSNVHCQYMQGLTYVASGRYYDGVKASTKVMIQQAPTIKMSSEFIKAHYLREYARYLHSRLDRPLSDIRLEEDLQDEFRDRWVKMLPFRFKPNTYQEQRGLQPEISDVRPLELEDYSGPVQQLICRASKVGLLMQVSSDGFAPNKQLNLAMGLAALHIAQLLEVKWKGLKGTKGASAEPPLNWRELFSLAVQYRRVVDPEQPVVWVDSLPDFTSPDGYRSDITFIRGSVTNLRVMQYFDLVFKLAKTMLEHYSGNGALSYPSLSEDIRLAKTCEDLLAVARKRQINPHGFLVSTQVPSVTRPKEDDRLDGAILVLTEDLNGKIVFALNIANTPERFAAYGAELDLIFSGLQEEIRKAGFSRLTDVDSVLNLVLSLVYYFYNLMPLTRGSSAVAYTVAMGLVMSLGRQATGKLPSGKLLDMEAVLSGGPDTFIPFAKQWMNIKKSSSPVSSLPLVSETFPTLRSLLEVLPVNTASC